VKGLAVPSEAVTLWPEWGFAITHLGKDCENRKWPLPAEHLPMPLCIHAGAYVGGSQSKTAASEGLEGLEHHARAAGWTLQIEQRGSSVFVGGAHASGRVLPPTPIVCRAIVAVAVFDRVDKVEPSAFVSDADPWAVGPLCWRISRVLPLREPVAAAGLLKLWPISGAAFVEIRQQLADAVVSQALGTG
jgi:hypothetical protein